MSESRQELLAWLNSLLQLNMTKVEQCGTGAALCQVLDSIFLDMPMSRVKFNVNTEYSYLQNFKILTNMMVKHGIERPVPVENLVKCRMQDNLEFLQWIKRYWDANYPGGEYDAVGRRRASGATSGGSRTTTGGRTSASSNPRRGTTPTTGTRSRFGGAGGGGGASAGVTAALNREIETQKEAIAGLEKERDFYFAKLRDIELLLQQAVEQDPELEKDDESLVRHIQAILYSTEEGFEIPPEAEVAEVAGEELETF